MIRTENLTKRYDALTAVKDLNIHVQKGEIYGFLGPNGAGKTTTIMMILGLLPPTYGKCWLFGEQIKDNYFGVKLRMGVLAEFHYLYEEMTAYEYLNFFARLYQVPNPEKKVQEVLSRVNLWDRRSAFLGGYSKGMKQKLSFARVLLHDPELLILDEPVNSLDPYGIKEIRDIITEEKERGVTVLLSSHILSEVERTCDRVGIMNKGRLLIEDSMDQVKRRIAEEREIVVELATVTDEVVQAVQEMDVVLSVETEGNYLVIKVKPEIDGRAEIAQAIASKQGLVLGMQVKEISLEDAFVTITEKNLSMLTKEGAA
ncbi:MAG: ABC transporter ATP-binding protein [Limnochordia bacterium]|jgi:ABC-2 type transport system ATP-binding protein|nr:ABC transporter ATP-binding protein [Limnochordia bacterium]